MTYEKRYFNIWFIVSCLKFFRHFSVIKDIPLYIYIPNCVFIKLSPLSLNTKYPDENAATNSSEISVPGWVELILYAGRFIVMSSGLPQNEWSKFTSPIYKDRQLLHYFAQNDRQSLPYLAHKVRKLVNKLCIDGVNLLRNVIQTCRVIPHHLVYSISGIPWNQLVFLLGCRPCICFFLSCIREEQNVFVKHFYWYEITKAF